MMCWRGGCRAAILPPSWFNAVVVAGAAGAISETLGDLQNAAGATERLFELLAEQSDVAPPARPVALPQPAIGAVTFTDVTFQYPSRPADSALAGFSADGGAGGNRGAGGPQRRGQDHGVSTAAALLRSAIRHDQPGWRRSAGGGPCGFARAHGAGAAGRGDFLHHRRR